MAQGGDLSCRSRQPIMPWGRIDALIRRRLAWLTMGSFWAEAYQSFRRTGGFVFTFLGFCAGVWAIYLPAPFAVDVRWLGGVALVCYIFTAASIDLATRALGQVTIKPKIVAGQQSDIGFQFLMESNRAFSHDSVISVFNVEGEFEVGIGWGRVVSIQESGRLQILMEDVYGKEELWGRICRPDRTLMSTLIVKATVPSALIRRP